MWALKLKSVHIKTKLCLLTNTHFLKSRAYLNHLNSENASTNSHFCHKSTLFFKNLKNEFRSNIPRHRISFYEPGFAPSKEDSAAPSGLWVRTWTQPNKMTQAGSSSPIRWTLWAARHLHASRLEGQAGKARAFLSPLSFCVTTDDRFRSGVFPGQWRLWLL